MGWSINNCKHRILQLQTLELGGRRRQKSASRLWRAAHKVLNSAKSSKPVGMGVCPLDSHLYHGVPGPHGPGNNRPGNFSAVQDFMCRPPYSGNTPKNHPKSTLGRRISTDFCYASIIEVDQYNSDLKNSWSFRALILRFVMW